MRLVEETEGQARFADKLSEQFSQDEATGELAATSSSICMKILYGARMCRPDLLHAIGRLASKFTNWTGLDDRKLLRLICYLNTTTD